MVNANGKHIIEQLEKKWRLNVLLSHLLVSLSVSMLLTAVLRITILISFLWLVPLFIFLFLLQLLVKPYWKINEEDVSRFLNQQYPQLEESAHLVLKPYESLNFLQKLQVQKTRLALAELPVAKQFYSRRNSSIVYFVFASWLSVCIVACAAIFKNNVFESPNTKPAISSPMPVEKILPEITSVSLQITTPAYTNKSFRKQTQFNLSAEEGSEVKWFIQTDVPVKKARLIFNNKQVLQLSPVAKGSTTLTAGKLITKSGFYQVSIDNKISEFYKIEVIKDLPPVIAIQTPQPHITIDFGMPEKAALTATLLDDYGISDALISATISSGSGEAVTFKEQQLQFPGFVKGRLKYNLKKILDLKQLGLQPGDELYFYVKATDNHNQQNRSDVYIITLEDTTQLMSMDGLVNGIDLKPEYFRSERQIIIETEQLLKDRDTITAQEFNNRSNNLGIDQKLLRLRYGKFLGEENENEIGVSHDHDEAGQNDATDFGNAAKIIDEYAHKHDNAEDATFFEPELKAQLRATLSEMWKAELQLRLNKPHDALPFEYKALRLLKDLQQKSRVYVAKTGFKSTPLKPEKRLTGDLTKINQPVNETLVEKKKDEYEVSRKAAGLLALIKSNQPVSLESIESLQKSRLQLFIKAGVQPSVYLAAVTAMDKIIKAASVGQKPRATDLDAAESGLQKLLSSPQHLPHAIKETSYESLSGEYFKGVNKGKRQ